MLPETRQGRRRTRVDAVPRHAKGGGAPESTLSRDTPRDAVHPSRRYPETRQGTRRVRRVERGVFKRIGPYDGEESLDPPPSRDEPSGWLAPATTASGPQRRRLTSDSC